MARAWLRAGLCGLMAALIGCGSDSRDSIIKNTNTLVAEVASSAGTIKSKVDEFVRKKDAKDDEGAKKELEEAVAEAKKLEDTAKKLQMMSARASNATPATAEEKKANLKNYEKAINATREELISSHREMKKALADANKKYEDALKPLMVEMSKAEGEFAAIVRKK